MAYLAGSLGQLRAEINAAHPNRDKRSDGWIGDAAHAGRVSDHNPDPRPNGVVRALDVDKDGMDKAELRRVVLSDSRTEYFIQDGVIYTRSNSFRARTYTGANKHTEHAHVSIRHGAQWENDTRPWGYKRAVTPPQSPAPAPVRKNVAQLAQEVLDGRWGNNPERQRRLQAEGYNYDEVQLEVNRRLGAGAPAAHRPSLFEIAQQVIRGEWDNGVIRRQRLEGAGYNYRQVQDEVNRQLRK